MAVDRARLAAWCYALTPGIVALCLYAPVTGFGFVWDDYDYLVAPGGASGWSALWAMALRPFLDSTNYFRPLALLSLGAEQILWSGPASSHAVNLLLHACNSILVGRLGAMLGAQLRPAARPAWTGLLAGTLYACHPALTEAVAWISGRFDLLATFFCLLLLLCDRAIAAPRLRAAGVGLLFLCAALCKEMALGLALMLPLWHYAFLPPARGLLDREHALVYLAVFVAGLACLGLRDLGLGHVYASTAGLRPQGSFIESAALVGKTLAAFWTACLFPFGTLSPLHELDALPVPWGGMPVFGFAGLALAGMLLRNNLRSGARTSLLLCASVLAFVPAMNLLPLESQRTFFNERFLVLPLAPLCMWVALLAAGAMPRPRVLALAPVLIWMLAAIPSLRQAQAHWKSELDLWLWAYSRAPASVQALENLQGILLEAGYSGDSLNLAEHTRSSTPQAFTPLQQGRYAIALFNLGREADATREMDQAINWAAAAAQRSRSLNLLRVEAGWFYLNIGRAEQALALLQPAVRERPDDLQAAIFMAAALETLGRHAQAQQLLDHAAPPGDEAGRQQWRQLVETATARMRRGNSSGG